MTLGNGTFATNAGGAVAYSMNFIVAGPTTAAIPEPATLALLGIGVAGLGLSRRKRTT